MRSRALCVLCSFVVWAVGGLPRGPVVILKEPYSLSNVANSFWIEHHVPCSFVKRSVKEFNIVCSLTAWAVGGELRRAVFIRKRAMLALERALCSVQSRCVGCLWWPSKGRIHSEKSPIHSEKCPIHSGKSLYMLCSLGARVVGAELQRVVFNLRKAL